MPRHFVKQGDSFGAAHSFHEQADMSKKINTLFLVGRRIVGKAGVDLASDESR
jgi:hypothetical protein